MPHSYKENLTTSRAEDDISVQLGSQLRKANRQMKKRERFQENLVYCYSLPTTSYRSYNCIKAVQVRIKSSAFPQRQQYI